MTTNYINIVPDYHSWENFEQLLHHLEVIQKLSTTKTTTENLLTYLIIGLKNSIERQKSSTSGTIPIPSEGKPPKIET